MLYIDGLSLSLFKSELINEINGKKVSKIYQYDKYNISIFFGKQNLHISISPAFPILYIADQKEDALDTPLLFSLSMRKYLIGSTLINISQIGIDRILIFEFEKLNELGELNRFKLIFEMMGKHSNLFLCTENDTIIDLLKKMSIDENKLRVLLPGSKYTIPKLSDKFDPFTIAKEDFDANIHTHKDIFTKIEGFGKALAMEIELNFDSFHTYISNLQKNPTIYYDLDNNIKFASLVKLDQFSDLNSTTYDSINEMINSYIYQTISSRKHNEIKNKLLKVLDNEIQKNNKIIKLINKDIEKNSDYEKYKNIGDILAANIYSIKYNPSSVELFDFYNNENITISLDQNLSPSENLDKYYKKYNKLKRAETYNYERLQNLKDELVYLDSVLNFVNSADTIEILKSIEDELIENNYMKAPSVNKKKKKKITAAFSPEKYISQDGFDIFVGKNNKENDFLTFKMSQKNDIWLHVKHIPGSHVLIRNPENLDVPNTTINQAASLAAFFSKGKLDNKVTVDYTLIKYVKKPKGAKPGFVIYTHETSIEAAPQK